MRKCAPMRNIHTCVFVRELGHPQKHLVAMVTTTRIIWMKTTGEIRKYFRFGDLHPARSTLYCQLPQLTIGHEYCERGHILFTIISVVVIWAFLMYGNTKEP